jgi:hypothetical protein
MAPGLLALTTPAWAQWARVDEIPATEVFSVWADADTIAAGTDTVTYVSTNAGTSWQRSATPVDGVAAIEAVRVRNGRLYAGTFGQGAFISDDLGATWTPFNQGLVGGLFDSQLFLDDFQVRGDSLYAATEGAGVYVRSLSDASGWQPFGDAFEPNQASNVSGLALGGTRLLASAGANGMVFIRDPGDPDWTVSDLDNVGIHAGLQAAGAAWTGTGWVVGTNAGVFRSVAGQEPWTPSGPGLGPLLWTSFATQGSHLFAAFDTPTAAVIEESGDDGATWQNAETLPGVFVEKMAISGNTLYAARGDGLWRRPAGTASVAAGGRANGLRFAVAGPQPFGDRTRLRFHLPEAGTASIDVFDVLGRAVGVRMEAYWSSGVHEVSLDARRLPPGIYSARLTAHGSREAIRLVHVR